MTGGQHRERVFEVKAAVGKDRSIPGILRSRLYFKAGVRLDP